MRVKSLLCVFFLLLMAGGVFAQVQTGSAYPKREFRAAWIQSVNGQFRGMPTEKLKQNLIGQLNSLQKAGINAIIFQVRPEAWKTDERTDITSTTDAGEVICMVSLIIRPYWTT